MTYYESAEDVTITAKRAECECKKHGADFAEMVKDLGEHAEYQAQDVLGWLGY